MIEHRRMDVSLAALQLEQRSEGQLPNIVGYGAKYYDGTPATEFKMDMGKWGVIVERILPGAFTRSAAEDDVVGLFNHDPNEVLGRTSAGTMKLSIDAVGLRYDITPPTGNKIVESIRRGDVKGSSFSFTVRSQRWTDTQIDGIEVTIRELMDVKLYDVGPVVFPAYAGATTGVRAYDPEVIIRELEAHRASRIDFSGAVALRRRQVELAEIL